MQLLIGRHDTVYILGYDCATSSLNLGLNDAVTKLGLLGYLYDLCLVGFLDSFVKSSYCISGIFFEMCHDFSPCSRLGHLLSRGLSDFVNSLGFGCDSRDHGPTMMITTFKMLGQNLTPQLFVLRLLPILEVVGPSELKIQILDFGLAHIDGRIPIQIV